MTAMFNALDKPEWTSSTEQYDVLLVTLQAVMFHKLARDQEHVIDFLNQ